MNDGSLGPRPAKTRWSFLLLTVLLGGALLALCREGFKAYAVHWANDVSLAALMESSSRLPSSMFGCWADFWWLGGPNVGFQPNLTTLSMCIFRPEHQLKFYVPGSMFLVGFGAWFLFRQLRFNWMTCVIGALGAGLNMHFFSNATWGLGNWDVCFGMIFIALGVLVSPSIEKLWIKAVLAGMAVGMAVMEGNDVGAIMSIYVAVFLLVFFLATESAPARGVSKTVYAGAVLVLSAVLISLSTIHSLVGTQIVGTAGVGPTESDKRAAWDANTQFSIPKVETLRMIIPGLFGYRLNQYTTSTNPATYYWGRVAEDPNIGELESDDPAVRSNAVATIHLPWSPQDRARVQVIMAGNDIGARENIVNQVKQSGLTLRHTGNGEYAGVLVCLLALFALASLASKVNSPFSVTERRMVMFWGAVGLFSLLAAWGRYSFLYAWIYHLPLVASFRNPQKYMHPLNFSLIILAGYGVEALARKYLAADSKPSVSVNLWKRTTAFDKWWVLGCAVAFVCAVIGCFVVDSRKNDLIHHLLNNGFDPTESPQIASFCISEIEWFLVYLALSIGVVICIIAGLLGGRRSAWAWGILALIMICDLYRSDQPWVRYYNYKAKIAELNPVTELLQKEPWEHRVNSRVWPPSSSMTPSLTYICHWWLENDYPFHDIQSLEIDQAPRMPVLDSSYLNRFADISDHDLSPATRLWRLTNTRYLIAGVEWVEALNQLGEPKHSFRTVMRLDVVNKPGITKPEDSGDQTVQTNSDGKYALIEYIAALPRAKLYSDWKSVDDATALRLLGSEPFDPAKTVLVDSTTPISNPSGIPEADPGTVKITHYESKHLMMDAEVKTPAVLLLNDHTGDSWHVLVDQKPAPLLRCNYIMQGTFVPSGHHNVEFVYRPPIKLLLVSLSTLGFGLLLTGYVFVRNFNRASTDNN